LKIKRRYPKRTDRMVRPRGKTEEGSRPSNGKTGPSLTGSTAWKEDAQGRNKRKEKRSKGKTTRGILLMMRPLKMRNGGEGGEGPGSEITEKSLRGNNSNRRQSQVDKNSRCWNRTKEQRKTKTQNSMKKKPGKENGTRLLGEKRCPLTV